MAHFDEQRNLSAHGHVYGEKETGDEIVEENAEDETTARMKRALVIDRRIPEVHRFTDENEQEIERREQEEKMNGILDGQAAIEENNRAARHEYG